MTQSNIKSDVPLTRRILLPLEQMGEFHQTVVECTFRIQGIGVWGATTADIIERQQIGHERIEAGSLGFVPAQFYALPEGWGYSELAGTLERGEQMPLTWGPDYTLMPNTMFRLRASRNGMPIGLAQGFRMACWGIQIIFPDTPDFSKVPADGFFELLARERGALLRRLEQIDSALTKGGIKIEDPGKPKIADKDKAN